MCARTRVDTRRLTAGRVTARLAEKESTSRKSVIGIEKDGTRAYGLFQFHETTVLPFLSKLKLPPLECLTSVGVQVRAVVELLTQDLRRSNGDVKGGFSGAHTRKGMNPIIDCLIAQQQGQP